MLERESVPPSQFCKSFQGREVVLDYPGDILFMYKNSRKANTECSEKSTGKFMNKTKDRYVLQCVV